MQICPSTGRRLRERLAIRASPRDAHQPGVEHPARHDLLRAAWWISSAARIFALASYNAGENRVERWIAERPGFEQDEFIDDIPFPETQNYVKKILGTAEDYRRLYGALGAIPNAGRPTGSLTTSPAPAAPAKKVTPKKSQKSTKKPAPKRT